VTAPGGLAGRPRLSTPYAEPRGEAEREMAALLARLFGFDRIGRDDDFFEFGGDSLLGIQFISNINRHLGSRLTLKDLYEQPPIAALADLMDSTASAKRTATLPGGTDAASAASEPRAKHEPINAGDLDADDKVEQAEMPGPAPSVPL